MATEQLEMKRVDTKKEKQQIVAVPLIPPIPLPSSSGRSSIPSRGGEQQQGGITERYKETDSREGQTRMEQQGMTTERYDETKTDSRGEEGDSRRSEEQEKETIVGMDPCGGHYSLGKDTVAEGINNTDITVDDVDESSLVGQAAKANR